MNLLAIDTSTDALSIAVQRGMSEGASGGAAAQVFAHTGPGGALASSSLIPLIEALMQQAGLTYTDLGAIAFGAGPGSFTGLRTACSVAQGLAFGVGLPVLPVDTLLAVAEEARFQLEVTALAARRAVNPPGKLEPTQPTSDAKTQPDKPLKVFALLDARMSELYACCYEYSSNMWFKHGNMGLIRPENLLSEGVLDLADDLDCVMAGNVFAPYAHLLPASAHCRAYALPTATALLRLAPALLAAGGAVNADQALPIYIRDKVAETTQELLQKRLAVLSNLAVPPSEPRASA